MSINITLSSELDQQLRNVEHAVSGVAEMSEEYQNELGDLSKKIAESLLLMNKAYSIVYEVSEQVRG